MNSVKELILQEEKRQQDTLMMIASENYTYPEVRDAVGSVLMHKYSEGYPGKRYYQGNAIIDEIEELAIEETKKVFDVPHANVQPYSGSPANSAVYFGLLNPGDTIMGLSLSSGGHLTHGHPNITLSGKYYKSMQYGVTKDGWIDYDALEELAKKEKPKLIIAGLTAYPRNLDWERFSDIAKESESLLLADISHIGGLVAAKAINSPVPFVHVVTTTTHKTLRGPRGAIVMVTQKGLGHDLDMGKKINKAVFPGLQGGPHDNTTAGIAITMQKAQTNEFKEYAKQVIKNAQVLAKTLQANGIEIITGGTDNHLLVVDIRKQSISGKDGAVLLEQAGIVVNSNTIPFDPNPPMNPSGIRLGTAALTTRGMKEKEMKIIGEEIAKIITTSTVSELSKDNIAELTKNFPIV
jgi:glycine hydroxymethyltransferase